MLSDPFSGGKQFSAPATAAEIGYVGAGIYVVVAGNLAFQTFGGDDVGPFAVTVGQLIPFRVKALLTGTTATVIVGKN